MSKLTESFATVRVHNGRQYADSNVVISYLPATERSARWMVSKGDERTDLEAGWSHGWRKTFIVSGRHQKPGRLEQAKTWASERYGITEWAKTPYGDWMDAGFVAQRTAELKAAVKELAKEGAE